MKSKNRRSIVKAITWQSSGVIVLYLLTGNITLSASYVALRIGMYIVHERLWQKVSWGWEEHSTGLRDSTPSPS